MTRRMTYAMTPPEPPTQVVGPRYTALDTEKQVSKNSDGELAYPPVCHPLMKKHDKKFNKTQPTNRNAEKREHSLIPPKTANP